VLTTAAAPARGFLLHAYGGPAAEVPAWAARGAYFSFNATYLDPRKEAARAAFLAVPLDRLLVETDAPAMPPPQAWRTHKLPPSADGSAINHPGNLESAYTGLAALRSLPLAELTAQIAQNFHRFFGARIA
jgi:TatD DNase family protein